MSQTKYRIEYRSTLSRLPSERKWCQFGSDLDNFKEAITRFNDLSDKFMDSTNVRLLEVTTEVLVLKNEEEEEVTAPPPTPTVATIPNLGRPGKAL